MTLKIYDYVFDVDCGNFTHNGPSFLPDYVVFGAMRFFDELSMNERKKVK